MSEAIPLVGAPLLPQPRNEQFSPEIHRVGHEFEAMFLAEMLAPMFEGLDTDGLGGGGMGEQIFRPMLVERYAQSIAQSGGVGVAESIMRELTRLQAAQGQPTEEIDGPAR
ncbi:rod-binding protein [Terricaulis sp.]|uniref:rod-binding protein n=1 Tax=Terricaulis sp. TaxID=2768686 RepID=UPI00378496BA